MHIEYNILRDWKALVYNMHLYMLFEMSTESEGKTEVSVQLINLHDW